MARLASGPTLSRRPETKEAPMKRRLLAGLAVSAALVALPLSQAGAAPRVTQTTSPLTLISDPVNAPN